MENQASGLITWLTENWAIVALIVSETIALAPGKYKGILQFALKIAGKILLKKSSKS